VVSNFYQQIFYLEMLPAMFIPANPEKLNYLAVKAHAGKGAEVNERLEKEWHAIAPDDPYEGFEQKIVMDEFYKENEANVIVLSTISGFALILACIGLYGLVSFQVSRRMKEISIRKVLGAGTAHLTKVINRDYYIMLIIAMILGLPMGYWLIDQLIQSIYPDPEPTTVAPFIISVVILGLAITLTLGSQLLRIHRENPVDTLRSE
jgi:ABC-type antimicrobial peptide transport system permease subunit